MYVCTYIDFYMHVPVFMLKFAVLYIISSSPTTELELELELDKDKDKDKDKEELLSLWPLPLSCTPAPAPALLHLEPLPLLPSCTRVPSLKLDKEELLYLELPTLASLLPLLCTKVPDPVLLQNGFFSIATCLKPALTFCNANTHVQSNDEMRKVCRSTLTNAMLATPLLYTNPE